MAWRLSQRADDDLLKILLQGEQAFGAVQATRYAKNLERVFGLLASQPMMARTRDGLGPSVRVHPCGAHVILYEIDDRGVLILRVRDAREDWLGDPSI